MVNNHRCKSPRPGVVGPLPNGRTSWLINGGFNPSEKYARKNRFIFPNFRGEHKDIFELPPPT